jgi:hypothetical protein
MGGHGIARNRAQLEEGQGLSQSESTAVGNEKSEFCKQIVQRGVTLCSISTEKGIDPHTILI